MKSKSLRNLFVRNIIIIFFCILIILFFAFGLLFENFFASTVTQLNILENKLLSEHIDMQIVEQSSIAQSLSNNALLANVIFSAQNAQEFNNDHNHNFIVESFKNAEKKIDGKNSELWAYSINGKYTINESGIATSEDEINDININSVPQDVIYDPIIISHKSDEGEVIDTIIPVVREGVKCGYIGVTLNMKDIITSVNDEALINAIVANCSIIIPTLNKDLQVIGYTECLLDDNNITSNALPADFTNQYTDNIKESKNADGESGKKYLQEISGYGWYISSFVTNNNVIMAFLYNYLSKGFLFYIIIMTVVLIIVANIAYRLTKPLKELQNLVGDLSANRPYTRLKGNNEITRAADSLIDFSEYYKNLLDEIKTLANHINEGKLFTRLVTLKNNGIKPALNLMLDSITGIFDTICVGVIVVDKDFNVLYVNKFISDIININKDKIMEGINLKNADIAGIKNIINSLEKCQSTHDILKENIKTMGMNFSVITKPLDYEEENCNYLQVFFNQTELIGKIQEQEQIFAYFEHLSLMKQEALSRLAKGDFKNAYINVGKRPSSPYLQAIYDQQLEMQDAFRNTVNNIELIIDQLSNTTKKFAQGNLYSAVDCKSATGKYAQLINTANMAFNVILKYFQYIPIPIRIISKDFKIKFYNDASLKTGFKPGKNVYCYNFYGADKPCETCPICNNFTEISLREFSLKINDCDYYYKIYRNPILDENGQITGMLEIRIDETEIVNLKKVADSANKAKSTFIANMSHEIRTPMNAILGYSQLLQLSDDITNADLNYVKTIKQSGNHLLNLINDILEMSKIEAGKVTILNEQFNLHNLFEDAANMFKPQMDTKGLSFEVVIDPDIPRFAIGDALKIRQMLFNVISNAYKFTNLGSIKISGTFEKKEKEKIKVAIDVTDTGFGIEQTQQERVFVPFEQTDVGNKTAGGTGLGMSISRNFARMMGGDITIVKSIVGSGTTFRIEFIVCTDENVVFKEETSKNYAAIKKIKKEYTILVVDDRIDSREILKKIFTKIGFKVIEASNGKQAIKLFDEYGADIVTTEFNMPEASCIDIIKHIRQKEKNSHTPIIVITANALDSYKKEAEKEGADAFLTKPFVIEKVLKAIESLVDVEYEFYEEESKSEEISIGNINDEIKEQIKTAVLLGDFDTVCAIAEKIDLKNPQLASKLVEYADDFDKDAIIGLLGISL